MKRNWRVPLALACTLSCAACNPDYRSPLATDAAQSTVSGPTQAQGASLAGGYLSALEQIKARQLVQKGASQFVRVMSDITDLADTAEHLTAVRCGQFVEASTSVGSPIAWSDSGIWPVPLATGTISGVLSGQVAGQEVERYAYTHEIQALNDSQNAAATFRRVEEVLKSASRPQGLYGLVSGKDDQQRLVTSLGYSQASGSVRRFGQVDYAPGGEYERVYSGETPGGASGSFSVETQVNLASGSFRHVHTGKVRTESGREMLVIVGVRGYKDRDGSLMASGSVIMNLPTDQASSSIYADLHLDPDAPAANSSGTLIDMRPDINPLVEAIMVPLTYVPERKVFRMGDVLELPARPLLSAIDRAKKRARALGL